MLTLLKKIKKKPRFSPATDEPPPESPALQTLVGTIKTREWLEYTLEELEFVVMELDAEIYESEHVLECERCLLELQLSVERYLGTRGPWWVDISNEIGLDDDDWEDEEWLEEWERTFPDMPKVKDYNTGWYGHESEDTIRFIKDRCKWASIQTEKRFKAACQLIKQLENYDVKQGIPEVSWIEGMIKLAIEEKENS